MKRSLIAVSIIACFAGGHLLKSQTTQPYAGKPYNGKPAAVPGVIKATEYDISPDGKNDVTFHYEGEIKPGDSRKTPDAIGLGKFGPDHVALNGEAEKLDQNYLGWTHTGEWANYSLHVEQAGTYIIGGHFAAAGKDGTISFSFGPAVTTGPIAIPTTAGYQPHVEVYHVWERLEHLAEVELPAGDVVMTMKIENSGGFNIESITLTKKP